jgi:hypothetical protein
MDHSEQNVHKPQSAVTCLPFKMICSFTQLTSKTSSGLLGNVKMRRWARGYRRFERMCFHFPGFKMHEPEAHENEGDRLFRNVGNTLPRRPEPTLLASLSLDHSVSTLLDKTHGPCRSNVHITDTFQVRCCLKVGPVAQSV